MNVFPSALVAISLLASSCSGVDAHSAAHSTGPLSANARADDLAAAQAHLDANRLDEALAITDRLIAADRSNKDAWLLAGKANLQLVESGRSGAQFFLLDAIRAYKNVVDIDPKDAQAWVDLADLRLKNSEFDLGIEAGRRALSIWLAEDTKGTDAQKASAALAVANNQMQIFVDARREELQAETRQPAEATVALANEVLASLNSVQELGDVESAALVGARTYQWLDRASESLAILERAIAVNPASDQLHATLRDVYMASGSASSCVGAYKRLLRNKPDNAILVWHLGRSQVLVGDERRRGENFSGATKGYEDAIESFARCADLRPAYADSCAQWRSICEISMGRMALEAGDYVAAERHHDNAYQASPRIAELVDGRPVLWDAFNRSYLGNLSILGQKLSENEDDPAAGLAAGLALYEKLIDRHPDAHGWMYNNAALNARDLGELIVAQAADGDETAKRAALQRAMSLWESSYAYYEKAVALWPDDARTVNDCGLMLVYYLKRDYTRAGELFARAIQLGEAALADLPEDAPEATRHNMEEAVGDAYQNTGVMLRQMGRPAREMRPYFSKSLAFFPYERRESTQYLAEIDGSPKASTQRQDPANPELDKKIAEAKKKADAGDFDGALLALDKIAKEAKGYAPFHYHFGLFSLRFADQARQNGGSAGLVTGLYGDAVAQLEQAVALNGSKVENRLRLAEAATQTGEWTKVVDAAQPVVKGADIETEQMQEALSRVGAATARLYSNPDTKQPEHLAAAREAFGALEKLRPLSAEERGAWVTAERWAGTDGQPVAVLKRALEQTPDDEALLGEFVEVGRSTGRNEAVVDLLDKRRDALGIWFGGRAYYNLAQSQWSGGNPAEAIKSFDKGVSAFDKAKQANAAYAASCETWKSFCIGARALVHSSMNELEKAEADILAALDINPGALMADLGAGTLKRAVLVVGDKHFQARDLGKTADLYIEVGKRIKDDVDLANNEGLFARDYGVQVMRAEGAEKAMPYFEASYAAYTRANRLDPENVRLRNDRALILVYHLRRELDTARELLESAARDGETQMAENPPTDPAERQNLEEAIGDSYENLGLYHVTFSKDYATARKVLEKSFDYYPGQRRGGARRHLRTLEQAERDGGNK